MVAIGLPGFSLFRVFLLGSSNLGIQEEQGRRHDLLLRALDACPDLEQALTVAVRMEQFIIGGQTLRKKPHEVPQPAGQPSSEGSPANHPIDHAG